LNELLGGRPTERTSHLVECYLGVLSGVPRQKAATEELLLTSQTLLRAARIVRSERMLKRG
jgi:hypothetical protein